MLRTNFREAYLKTIGTGITPLAIVEGRQRIHFEKQTSLKTSRPKSLFRWVRPLPSPPKKDPKNEKTVEGKKETNQTPEIENFSRNITAMDLDIAKRKLAELFKMGKARLEICLLQLGNEFSRKALTFEKKTFYDLFGSNHSEHMALANLVAHEIDTSTKAYFIVNTLIEYLKNLSKFLVKQIDSGQTNLKARLFKKYKSFGVNKVYGLIKSISQKIKTRNHWEINNECLFPTIDPEIKKVFQTLMPIEF